MLSEKWVNVLNVMSQTNESIWWDKTETDNKCILEASRQVLTRSKNEGCGGLALSSLVGMMGVWEGA